MSEESKLKELFLKWEEVNSQVGESFQELDFPTIKKFRKEQREIEDNIYEILLKTAPNELREILPVDPGSMEMGYEREQKTFYFLTEDPEYEEEEEIHVLAITINADGEINTIKNFNK